MKKTLSAISFAVAGALLAGGAVAQSNNIGLPGTLA